MCMNCGCGRPNDDHGKPGNITAADLRRAGEANSQSFRESAQHIVETVELLEASRDPDRGRTSSQTYPVNSGRGTPATES